MPTSTLHPVENKRRRRLGRTTLEVSRIGFGASPLGDVFRPIGPAEGARAVHQAIDLGINFFDVSPYYGLTLAEERLGAALAGHRDEVVLASKCGRYDADRFDFSRERIRRSLEESLRRLRTDRLDLLQAHDVEFGSEAQLIEETVPAMRELQAEGKVGFIGITGYPLGMLVRVARAAPVDTILSYCRYNLLTTDMDRELTPFAREHGIGLINASPLSMGLLTEGGVPDWHPAPQRLRDAAAAIVRLCREHGTDIATVALQFCTAHPYVSSTLVGMASPEQVRANLAAAVQAPDPELLARIREAVAPVHGLAWPSGRTENTDPEMEIG